MTIQSLIKEYAPNDSLFCEDDEQMVLIKQAVASLSPADRIIFILYAETGSLREVGKMLGVSHTTIYKEIKRIKRYIYDYIGIVSN